MCDSSEMPVSGQRPLPILEQSRPEHVLPDALNDQPFGLGARRQILHLGVELRERCVGKAGRKLIDPGYLGVEFAECREGVAGQSGSADDITARRRLGARFGWRARLLADGYSPLTTGR